MDVLRLPLYQLSWILTGIWAYLSQHLLEVVLLGHLHGIPCEVCLLRKKESQFCYLKRTDSSLVMALVSLFLQQLMHIPGKGSDKSFSHSQRVQCSVLNEPNYMCWWSKWGWRKEGWYCMDDWWLFYN